MKPIRKILFSALVLGNALAGWSASEYEVTGKTGFKPDNPMTLWYLRPVTVETCSNPWMDYALPIGNGQLGAMLYAGIQCDEIQFNEKTLWTGSFTERGAYQNFGSLLIENLNSDLSSGVSDYVRSLDISKAVGKVSYTDNNGVKYSTEYIASNPGKVIAIHLTADKAGKLSRRISLKSAHSLSPVYSDNKGSFQGKLTTLTYEAKFAVEIKGGTVSSGDNGVTVTDADEITIYLTAATDYDPVASGYISATGELDTKISKILNEASTKGWKSVFAEHKTDYEGLFSRVSLSLGSVSNDVPTNELISLYGKGTEGQRRMLEQLYFQYGRYLLIASSRGLDLPSNLQGIWNNNNAPAWQCDMHANINVQMNYWPAEKTALPEMHEKYLNYLYNMAMVQPQWQGYAKDRSGQTTGWVNYTENNIFGHCTTWHNDYVEAGAWACAHLWQHYRYTLDKDFLKKTALPVMLSSVDFWMERLVKDSKDGSWVCPNEWSPEHGPDKTITAHAQQIVWNLFSNTIEAIDALGVANAGVSQDKFDAIKEKFANLDNGLHTETYQGTYGSPRCGVTTGSPILREWKYVDYATGNGDEKDHRHLSHLMAMYPLNNVSKSDPIFVANVNSLKLRGMQSQGWSMGWKMNLWARALQGDSCRQIFDMAFNHSTSYGINMSPSAGGVYYNLLDAHSPFQIDGNFGVCAGMAEMLLQNDKDTLLLLPALPTAWSEGEVKGLKAENNMTVDLTWNKGKLSQAKILSGSGRPVFLRHDARLGLKVASSTGLVNTEEVSRGVTSFATTEGETYTVELVERQEASAPGRQRINLNRSWKFYLGDMSGAESTAFDDGNWTDANLPHSFSIPYFMWKDVYHGYGWYRKHLTVTPEMANKNVEIEFEGSFIETEVYVNEVKVGTHSGGYTTFSFDLTPYLNEGDNVIAVRVNNLWNAQVAPRAGDHQFSGGIYRDVWLNLTDRLHVDVNGCFVTTPAVSESEATCKVETEVVNNYSTERKAQLSTKVLAPNGTVVSEGLSAEVTLKPKSHLVVSQDLPKIGNPQLWSPETPSLYKAVSTVKVDGQEVDTYTTPFGIRTMEWTADKGFFLNGKHYWLQGANVHQDQAGWGDAVTNKAMERDVQLMKDAGFNCIRGSHYPHDPAFAHACDSIGMILFMENAFWGMGGNQNEAAWGEGAPASAYPTKAADQEAFDKSVLQQLKENIRQHRNSPSIAAWSLSNEPFFCSSSVDGKMKALLNAETDSVAKWDPTRKAAIGGAQRKSIDKLGKDAIAFYNGDGASRSDNQNPGVPNLVSEYGSTSCDRPGSFAPGWGDVGDGLTNQPAWRSGHVIWCGFDHGTVGGYELAKMGLVDYFRIPKRSYYWYQEAYKNGQTSPQEPEWAEAGTPSKLSLTASSTTLHGTDGTDDAQLLIKICDASGKPISNSVPVTLEIKSGPGEFPTGRKITFTPTTASYKEVASNPATDIRIQDGQAAIAFRSYHGGTSVIEATSPGLESAQIEITTEGQPVWQEGVDKPVEDRVYKRYSAAATDPEQKVTSVMTLADNRPTWSSSDLEGTNKANVNDGNVTTLWKPNTSDTERWWKVALEGSYSVNRIELTFPTAYNYRYVIEVSKDDKEWTMVVNQSETELTDQKRMAVGNFGDNISFVRVRFLSDVAGLAEVRVGGSTEPGQLADSFLSGTIIGTAGAWNNNQSAMKEATMDFDGDTFFDGPSGASSFWIGLDLGYGMEANVTGVGYMPRYNSESSNFAERMLNGRFQIANKADFSDARDIFTITTTPPYLKYSKGDSSDPNTKVRYVRYLSTKKGNGNVAELQFFGYRDETTGMFIPLFPKASTSDKIYNVQGMQVHEDARHGVYVQNGKKFIVK